MRACAVLGAGKVSCLERCPQFRGVLIEGFHCIQISGFLNATYCAMLYQVAKGRKMQKSLTTSPTTIIYKAHR